MSCSIIMNYFERPQQLEITLKSILWFSSLKNLEIIVVDDGSNSRERALPVIKKFSSRFPALRLIEIFPAEKYWCNPCVAFNRGIRQATGEVLILQNPECYHWGNIIEHIQNNITDKNYLTYSCKNTNKESLFELARLSDVEFGQIMIVQTKQYLESFTVWYNHPVYRPAAYHFLSAITKRNMDKLNGFDERYAQGFAFDDDELLFRIKKLGLSVIIVPPDEVFCIHQYHKGTFVNVGNDPRWKKNEELFHKVTKLGL